MKKLLFLAALLAAALPTLAQSSYNFQRRSLFEVLPIHSGDIVFLGNSITDGGEWNELLANPRVKNRGISGDRSGWLLDRLDPIVGGHPKKLFLMIGVNDLLNQNRAFSRTTGSGYTQNSTNSVIGRYYMVQFTYNLRRFGKKGSRNIKDYEGVEQPRRRSPGMMPPPPGFH